MYIQACHLKFLLPIGFYIHKKLNQSFKKKELNLDLPIITFLSQVSQRVLQSRSFLFFISQSHVHTHQHIL